MVPGPLNPLSLIPKKWSNTLKELLGKLPTNCLSVFDHFSGLALIGLIVYLYHICKTLSSTCRDYSFRKLLSSLLFSFFPFYSFSFFAKHILFKVFPLYRKHGHKVYQVNPFVSNGLFLYPLKISEIFMVFLMFSVGRERVSCMFHFILMLSYFLRHASPGKLI